MRILPLFLCLVLGESVSFSRAKGNDKPLLKQELSLPPGETRSFDLGKLPAPNGRVQLEVVARSHLSKLGGSMFFLKITLNGKEVGGSPSPETTRLVNKTLVSPVSATAKASWYSKDGWRVIYAPDFEAGRSQKFYADDPYRLELDVTDLIEPGSENRLEIKNTAPKKPDRKEPDGNLVFKTLTLHTNVTSSRKANGNDKPEAGAPANPPPLGLGAVINRGQPASGPAKYQGGMLPGGGFSVTVGSRQWSFTSAFSYPNSGFNRLLPSAARDGSSQPQWRPTVERQAEGGIVRARSPYYQLVRKIRFTKRKVEVADTLTNTDRRNALGLAVQHEVDLAGIANPPIRLAGNSDTERSTYYSPGNPSVHISLEKQGLALLCEDDVFRNQAKLFKNAKPPSAGMRTEMLRLGPGESCTLRWSVYPIGGPDYFDFVNLVRQDWGSNVTVDGAWTFFDPDPILALPVERIRSYFQRQGIRYAIYCGGWVDRKQDKKRIGFGADVMGEYWASFRQRLKDACARIHEAVPDVKVLVYFDTQRETSEANHKLFHDSWLTDLAGRPISTNWGGRYSITWSMAATLGNSYGKAMLATVDQYMDEMKIDGIYWDEMEHISYGYPLLSYTNVDGRSCLLNHKTHTIIREVGVTSLLGEAHRLAVIKRIRAKRGVVMGNTPCLTHALLATGVQRMVEIQDSDFRCYEGNLCTPLGFMSSRMDFGNFTRGLWLGCLPVGMRYTYEHEISPYLFPFTPIELHHGYLLGKERIVTLHSGDYGWPGDRVLVQAHHFDFKGKLKPSTAVTTVTAEARTRLEVAKGEAVVLERLPVSVSSEDARVEVQDVVYSPSELSLRVSARSPAEIQIATGKFSIRQDGRYQVSINGTKTDLLPSQDSLLHVKLPSADKAVIRITAQH